MHMTEMNDLHDWDRQIIEEFRANGGKVGGQFAGVPLLLLTTTGAKSGQQRISPLAYLSEGGRIYIFAGNRGAPTNPNWYHNLLAHPDVLSNSALKSSRPEPPSSKARSGTASGASRYRRYLVSLRFRRRSHARSPLFCWNAKRKESVQKRK